MNGSVDLLHLTITKDYALGSCAGSKKPTTIKHLGGVPRNRWKSGHTVAFLFDSQAKNP
jgi:hypothetical protein